jgi:hypothetical protein
MLIISIVLVVSIVKARKYSNYWYEPWSNEPELREYLGNKISLRVNSQFRGSVILHTGGYDEFLTLNNLWVDAVPTINEYSQLVTPQAMYFIHQLFKRNVSNDLNWFLPWINSGNASFAVLFRTFRALGVRYIGGYEPLHIPDIKDFPSANFPRRQPGNPPGLWVIHEISDVNIGDYSPTEITTARSAAEIVAYLSGANFDFVRQVVLTIALHDRLVPARDNEAVSDPRGLARFWAQRWHLLGRAAATVLQLPTCSRQPSAPGACEFDHDWSDFLRRSRHRYLL